MIHVPGWSNKAILYRVDSAVPPYFVEGVCCSSETCYTLEGCYEELKKTKRTYTPFSHNLLKQKLENRVSVLKPNELDIIKMLYGIGCEPMSVESVADFTGYTEQTIRNVQTACLIKMRRAAEEVKDVI